MHVKITKLSIEVLLWNCLLYTSDAADESAISVQLDLMSKESINNLFADLKSEDLLPSVLVNNAGITKDQLFLRMKDEDWDDVIETNLNGLFRVTKAFIKPMVKNKFGRVINISSVAGLMGNSGQVNYSSSKSAMVGFSRSLAKELGSRNITSNVVAPGFIETDMTTFLNDDEKVEVSKNIPMKRFGTVQDVAKCIVFLASDEANYITGQTISVDGGLFMY